MPLPATACILQHKLGAKKAAAFDVNAACSGFIYGLAIGDKFIRSGSHKRVLVVGTEILSKFTDWSDRTTCVLFGDGAGAVILERTEEDRGIIETRIHSDGSMWTSFSGGGLKPPLGQSKRQPIQNEG